MKRIFILPAFAVTAIVATAAGWDEMSILARPDGKGGLSFDYDNRIQCTAYTNAIFFDYNNDGNLDLLVMGSGADWKLSRDVKFLLLYKNTGPETGYELRRVPDATTGFLQAVDEAYLNPVTVGDVNHDGYADIVTMTYRGDRCIDLYLNNGGDGSFTHNLIDNKAMTNGAVTLGDINNDGHLDILANGWSADSAVKGMAVYEGNGDGTFVKTSPAPLFGTFEGHATLADLNGNGLLDIVMTGHGDNWSRHAKIFYNTPSSDGSTAFELVDNNVSGLTGVNLGEVLAADFNGDGLTDLALSGNDGDATRVRMFYRNADGTYTLDTSYPICPINTEGGINMGDWDGDGNMDIVIAGYKGADAPQECYATPLRIYRNTSDSNTRPEAPASVSVRQDGDYIEITWSDGSDDTTPATALRYNVYLRNELTGETFCIIPADPESGRLKVGTDLATTVSANRKSLRIKPLGNGTHTVGVQTLDQSFAPSRFTTATIEIAGVGDIISDNDSMRVIVDGRDVTVAADRDADIFIYTPDGLLAAAGSANTPLTLPGAGLYIITSPGSNLSPLKTIVR